MNKKIKLFLICILFLSQQVGCQLPADWQSLKESVQGRLIQVKPPSQTPVDTNQMLNPFFLEEQPWATQVTGWFGAWRTAISPYAIAAETTEDCVAAVNFARKHQLKLVIKGTGHDYLGRSNAPDSLLLWTHKMRKITMHPSFIPIGSPNTIKGVPAVTVQAGARWLEVYHEVTTKNGLYVQGGGCTSVGAAGGFILGGGFGSFSKKFGTGAANLLEAEVVTADGQVLIANAFQNSDLFWALRGGGGGTFGVVTQMTLRVHALPHVFGNAKGKIIANTNEAFINLIEQFIHFYREKLNTEHWGESIRINQNNTLDIDLVFQGLSQQEAETLWQPLRNWIEKERPNEYKLEMHISTSSAKHQWDYNYLKKNALQHIVEDRRNGQPTGYFWWNGDRIQVSAFLYTYQSRWIPLVLFEKEHAKKLAKTLFDASKIWEGGIDLHFNKGLAGASDDAIARGKETAMNPIVYDAAALVIIAAGKEAAFSGENEAREQINRVNAAMKIIVESTPGSGCYVNEADYFLKNWQQEFWGENYSKLLMIKQKYDPTNFFHCHHSVGNKDNN